jgi:chemotaxis protein CheD
VSHAPAPPPGRPFSPASTQPLTLPAARALASPCTVLKPGGVAVGTRGDRFETLLGSCVAVVLTDPRRTVGAMCHIVHANEPALGAQGDTAYARCALQAMFDGLRRIGISPQLCEAHVYGGGNMFPHLVKGAHVGASNARRALALLADTGIAVRSQSLGGSCYRKLSWVVGPADPECILVDVPGVSGTSI